MWLRSFTELFMEFVKCWTVNINEMLYISTSKGQWLMAPSLFPQRTHILGKQYHEYTNAKVHFVNNSSGIIQITWKQYICNALCDENKVSWIELNCFENNVDYNCLSGIGKIGFFIEKKPFFLQFHSNNFHSCKARLRFFKSPYNIFFPKLQA